MALTYMGRLDHDLERPGRLASCGRLSPFIRMALLDDHDAPVARDESGEICVRAPLVMEGYHEQPEQTEEAFAGGWHHTGDVGRFDEDGFLYVVDRKKDLIITGGFNVFPREVEDVPSAHPAVAQVAVIGVPDERWGESVKALVVLRAGAAPSESLAVDLKALVKDAKGSVYAPKSIDFVDAMPLSAVGMPDKKALRSRYWGDRARSVN